jgi:hypothetical protein
LDSITVECWTKWPIYVTLCEGCHAKKCPVPAMFECCVRVRVRVVCM